MKDPDDLKDARKSTEKTSKPSNKLPDPQSEKIARMEAERCNILDKNSGNFDVIERKNGSSPKLGTSDQQKNTYVVGYGKPPVEGQFRPGQSGNLKGRPKKTSAHSDMPELWEQRFKNSLSAEIYRMITVQDGNKKTKIPAIQAIIKRLTFDALRGDYKSQKLLFGAVKEMEEEDYKLYMDYTQELINAKFSGEAELEKCKKRNMAPPELIPHPYNIILNDRSGRLELIGPFTKKEKERFQNIREIIEELELQITAEINRGEKEGIEDKDNSGLQIAKKMLEELKLKVPLIVRWIKNGAH